MANYLLQTYYQHSAIGILERVEFYLLPRDQWLREGIDVTAARPLIKPAPLDQIQVSRDATRYERLEIGKVYTFPPYRLRIIDNGDMWRWNAYTAVPDTRLWWLAVLRMWLGRHIDLVYRRLILTAAVWGLADYDHTAYVMPTWRDLKIVKRIAALRKAQS